MPAIAVRGTGPAPIRTRPAPAVAPKAPLPAAGGKAVPPRPREGAGEWTEF
jgi:hypothetical protein